MEWLIIVGLVVWLIAGSAGRKRRLEQIDQRIRETESRLDGLERQLNAAPQPVSPAVAQPAGSDRKATYLPRPGPIAIDASPPEEVQAAPEAPLQPRAPEPRSALEERWRRIQSAPEAPLQPGALEPRSALEERWRRIERLFIENWTGILGTAVVVAGVTFIGIYTALKLAPFYRFLMTMGIAAALGGTSVFLRRREAWGALAEWVRSAAAAILLFACAASGGLPGLGLQWIDAAAPALALLVLGMAVNLYLSWTAAAQTFASLHVVLSVLPLMIVPQSPTSLGIVSVVALFGVMLSFRTRWDQHLLVVIGTYVLFHVCWYLRLQHELSVPALRYFAALNAIVVFGTAALVHYRRDYASQKLEFWPLLVHISNWALLALSLLLYRPATTSLRGFVLVSAGVVAYLLARRGRSLGVRWLYLCDTLTAQVLVVAGIASLYSLVANVQFILLAIFLESALFLRLVIDEGEDSLARVGWFSAVFAGALFAAGGLDVGTEPDLLNQNVLVLLVGAAAATGVHLYLTRRHGERLRGLAGEWLPQAVMGWLVGAIVIVALLNLAESAWMETVALLAAGALLFVLRAKSPPGVLAGAGAVVVVAHLESLGVLLRHMPWDAAPLAHHIGPLITLAVLAIWLAGSSPLRQLAIYLLGLDVALAAYLFFNPVSPLIPGVAWLLLSLFALEIANRVERPSSTSWLGVGYAYLAAFVGAYALVVIQTPAYIGPLPARLLIELLGLGVILYWWFYHPRQALGEHASWLRVHPFFLEFGLVALAVTNLVEVPAQWQPIAWALLALALLAPPVVRRIDERLRTYSVFCYWASLADVAVVMSAFESPSPHWYDRPDIMSLIAIVLLIGYIVMSHKQLALAGVRFPQGLRALDRLGERITARRNLWVYYPFFAGLALFLFWRFDRSVLTLLWSAEAFTVFVLSAVLRENQFRYAALAGLGVCLARLLFVDLAEANLGLRGLVFLGVGLLMLGMNAIYNRYRARFE